MPLPTIVLIPGAWHTPTHFTPLTTHLTTAGFTVISHKLPSVGSSNPKSESVETDTSFIRNTILLPLLDSGTDILLVMHSYGGIPGAGAAKGLSKPERTAAGEKAGIVGLVFITAFLATEGASLRDGLPGGKLDTWIDDSVVPTTGELTIRGSPKEIFFTDVPDSECETFTTALLPQAESAFSTPAGPVAWPDSCFDGKRAYIMAEKDGCVPSFAQEMMVKHSGVEWDVLRLDTGHSPFLSRVEEVGGFVGVRARVWGGEV